MSKMRRERHPWLVSRRWSIAGELIAMVVVIPVTFADSGNAISRMDLCSTSNLSGAAWLQGAAGQEVGVLTIENKGQTACRLPTRPSVVLNWRSQNLAIHQIPMPDEPSPSSILSVLKPHAKSQISLTWRNWCRPLPSPVGSFKGSLLVSLSHSSVPLRINVTVAEVARCDFPKENSTFAVGRFRSRKATS